MKNLTKISALIMVLALILSMLPVSIFAEGETFVMERVPGGTQKDVIANGEQRVIYCMQYDYLWPITASGYANPQTKYKEAESVALLTADQQAIIQRVLFAGYPYDSKGFFAPLYAYLDTATASDAAADITQGVIWNPYGWLEC